MSLKRRNVLQQLFMEARLSEKEFKEFELLWSEQHYAKKSFITEAGTVARHFYAVLQGVQVIYLIDQKGDKRILGFSYEGNPSGVYDSFLNQSPSHYFLEALTDSTLIQLSYEDYQQLFSTYPSFNRWGRLFHQEVLIGRVKREVELFTLPAKERYVRFMRRCPAPLLNIPQKHLASYLNMTPETFSRLRASVHY